MPDNALSVLLVGATGLVGRECLRLLLADSAFDRIVVVTRRPLSPDVRSPKLETHVVDFDHLNEYDELFTVDAIICALGTTIRQAGSRTRFRTVDYEYPLAFARLGRRHGCEHFLLVSALGASPRSRYFYNRVKGDLEESLRNLGFPRLTIVRPSLLLGPRAQLRLGEEVAKRVTRWLGPLVPRAYKPVQARAVAQTLLRAARESGSGERVIESGQIVEAAD
ncbi:MAG TPA: oxidoreductase [Gemmatimonadaceae bacterium]|nr:oxidoreductase [Gemmatimonadaceae bacterium]